MDDVAAFYDAIADEYTALFRDWDAAVERQGSIIDDLIRAHGPDESRTVLDATCGIGTQAIGLALRGYDVTATDISARSIERAAREASRLGAAVRFDVADVRSLGDAEGMEAGAFDVAITFDNALPHLVDREDLHAALGQLLRALRGGGLLLASVRDYDAIAEARPSGEPPRISGAPGARRAVVQGWEWEPGTPVYRLHQFILREGARGEWSAVHAETRYRALSRSELSAAAVAVGFEVPVWLTPAESGFYQPILAARRPAIGSDRP